MTSVGVPVARAATAYQELFALIIPSGPGGAGGGWGFAGHHNFKTNAAGKNVYFLVVTSTGNALKLVLVQIVIANKSLGSAEQEPDQFLFLNDRMRIGPHELSPLQLQGETLFLDVPQG